MVDVFREGKFKLLAFMETKLKGNDKIKRALKGRMRKYKVEEGRMRDKVYYKKNKKCGEERRWSLGGMEKM